jgi:hypothetical protein
VRRELEFVEYLIGGSDLSDQDGECVIACGIFSFPFFQFDIY